MCFDSVQNIIEKREHVWTWFYLGYWVMLVHAFAFRGKWIWFLKTVLKFARWCYSTLFLYNKYIWSNKCCHIPQCVHPAGKLSFLKFDPQGLWVYALHFWLCACSLWWTWCCMWFSEEYPALNNFLYVLFFFFLSKVSIGLRIPVWNWCGWVFVFTPMKECWLFNFSKYDFSLKQTFKWGDLEYVRSNKIRNIFHWCKHFTKHVNI